MPEPTSAVLLFLAGAVSGIAEGLAVQPFDMVKTRHQLNTGENLGVSQTISELLREGGVRRLYRGMLAELVGMVPKTSAMYSSYEMSRRYFDVTLGFGDTSAVCFLSGIAASFPEAIIVTPSQVVKVRLQAKEHLGRYRGPIHCLSQIFNIEGPSALFIGLGPTLWRNSVWNSIYFGTMHLVKGQMNEILQGDMSAYRLYHSAVTFASGFCGATFATCFNAPFDVVKSRFQSQLHLPGLTPKYRNTFQTLYLIYHEEGLKSCYKGFRPKVIRMGLGGAVAMTTFDAFLSAFKE
jgi:solute carrier family 25 (mitochondrial 2-oxodicarboxylate transporter), member 21